MYAQLCKRLSDEAPNFEPPDSPCTFRILLLNKCRYEFESRTELLDKTILLQLLDEDDRRQLAKRKMLGNIKFIGELGKLEILSESVLHKCIQQLLSFRRGEDPSEDLECLSQIMRTCGRTMDSDKGKKLMDQYFERMASLADNPELQPRIRFMLKDVIELRRDVWKPRKVAVIEGPVPIHQIRSTDEDRQGYRRDRNQDRDQDRSSNMSSELFRHPMKQRGGIDSMIMGFTLNSPSSNLISSNSFNSNGFGNQRDGGYRNNQRSGFNNFNNQRGQYNKHNQTNSNNQYNNQSNKELAPRFKKIPLVVAHEQDPSEVELRPSTNSMTFNKTSIKASNIMNSRPIETQLPPQTTIKQPPGPLLKEPLPIKQASTEKPKQGKKDKGPNKEEVLKKFGALLEEYYKGEIDAAQAIGTYKENKIPDKFTKDVVINSLTLSLDATGNSEEREKLIKFLACLRKENLLNGSVIQESFKAMCNTIEERENEITILTSGAATLLSCAVNEHLISLAEMANLTENGSYYPLFLLVLQHLHVSQGENELTKLFTNSKINLLSQLPESDKTKMRLAEILEERNLTFLYPSLRIQAELNKQLQADPNPQQFYKWIRENLEPTSYTDSGFINALMTVLLKYIQHECLIVGDEKLTGEKERSMLERYTPILQAFLREHPSLQMVALYSLQVHFYELDFPRGQILRWFMALYDLEIIEEEAFLTWKEDLSDAYPGKRKALFQVNQWLMWLQEAESEEEEEGEE